MYMPEINLRTARLILKSLRTVIVRIANLYQLSGTIELDDAPFGSRQKGKLGRGTAKKRM